MKKVIFYLSVFFFSVSWVFAEKVVINFDITVNKVGDARIVYTQKATAMQWKNLVNVYGQNPSLLKREIISSLPAYELENFSFKKDDMNRTMVFSFDAKGVVKYLGDGRWEFEYEKKSTPKKITETKWFFTNSETDGNVLYEYDVSLSLPDGAKDVKLTQNEFGKSVLRYTLNVGVGISWWVIAGILLLIAGIITVILGVFAIKE